MQNYGTGIVERELRDVQFTIDGRNATFSANVPETETHEEDYEERSEEVIHTNPVDLLRSRALPSLSLIRFAKVKNFIDGVYATVEERINEKGHHMSREDFLENLEGLVIGRAREYVSAARKRQTMNEPSMTLPQGFYDWTPQLTDAYRQIKVLSRVPGFFAGREEDEDLNRQVMRQLEEAIQRGDGLGEVYNSISRLYSRMTGKPEIKFCLFPSAELPDQEFFKQLSSEAGSDLPEGLGKLLVGAVKEGRVSFVPEKDSGLYLRQMHEITPLILMDTPEFGKFLVNHKYAQILENEFVSQWAGTRHTHVGHTSFADMMFAACMDFDKPIVVRPELAVEPFATSYERMGESLDFMGETIRTMVPEVLDRRRLLNNGSRANISIGEELKDMKLLLDGLSLISRDSIHLQYSNPNATAATKRAAAWLKDVENDPDLNRNTAIFVPIIRTTDGSRQVSYIDAGFKTIDVEVSYRDPPSVSVGGVDIPHELEASRFRFPILVHREVRVPYHKLINDRGLRELLNGSFTESELDKVVKRLED